MMGSKNPGAFAYMNAIKGLLDKITQTQEDGIDRAATAIVNSIKSGGMVYLFGTGHSHMLAEEGHTRAGGLAPVCPILSSNLMIHESAASASRLERLPGLAPTLLMRYQLTSQDVLIVFSNSGVNAVPVEMAIQAKQIGLTVIAVLSIEYTLHAPVNPLGKRLNEIADIVIDNQGPRGDAIVPLNHTELKVGPPSTVTGAFILNSIFTEVAWRIADKGETPPVYISGNMPNAAEHNSTLRDLYRTRNPHL